jgi:hypothetical protein
VPEWHLAGSGGRRSDRGVVAAASDGSGGLGGGPGSFGRVLLKRKFQQVDGHGRKVMILKLDSDRSMDYKHISSNNTTCIPHNDGSWQPGSQSCGRDLAQ